MAKTPHILLTPGDPMGIGPEITVKALKRLGELGPCRITVIGDVKAVEAIIPRSDLPLDVQFEAILDDTPGGVAFKALEKAVSMLADKKADSLVTGPISKRNLAKAGYNFAGHTEILEQLSKQYFDAPDARAEMLFVYKNFRLLLLTRHIALREVGEALSKTGAVARPLKTLIAYLRKSLTGTDIKLAMLGINPHAGELEGSDEEKKYLMPVIHAVNAIGNTHIDGPFPADGFFRSFDPNTTPYHAVVAPYHDQGLIPFKMLAGYEAVNVTIGLPFLRTSVSHGTAEDIVGKGIANEDSLLAAMRLAISSSVN